MPMTTQMVCRSWPRCAFRPPQRCHRPCDASAHRDHHSSDEPDLATAQRKTRRRPITSNHATAFDCPISARLANRPACSGQSAAHAAPLRAEVDAHIAAFAVERDKRVSQQVMADGSHTRPVLRFTPSCTCGWTRSCGRRQCPMCCRAAVGLGADWPVAVMGAVAQHGDRHIAAASGEADQGGVVFFALGSLCRSRPWPPPSIAGRHPRYDETHPQAAVSRFCGPSMPTGR